MSIQVVDNFLTEEETKKAYKYAKRSRNWGFQTSNPSWKFGISKPSKTNPISNSFLYLNIPKEETFFYETIFYKIVKIINEELTLQRVYINGQSFGSNGTFHTDGCDKTALIYLSPYDIEWGGFTEFILNENSDYPEIKCVAPFTSSMVIFDGNILHKGYSYSYQHCPIRYSLAYKLERKVEYESDLENVLIYS